MRREKVEIIGSLGSYLSAFLDLPEEEVQAVAVFAHCFTCSKNLSAVRHISDELTDHGIGVLRFDFTGLGQSSGEFHETSFSSNVEDVKAVAEWLGERELPPSILIGHSLGGAAAIKAAKQISSIKAVVTIGAPFDPEHVAHLFEEAHSEIWEHGEAVVSIGGRPFTISKSFLEDLTRQSLERTLQDLRCALLIMHSPFDNIVSIDNAANIFIAAKHPKSFVSLDSADHLLSNEADSRFAACMIGAWAPRYI